MSQLCVRLLSAVNVIIQPPSTAHLPWLWYTRLTTCCRGFMRIENGPRYYSLDVVLVPIGRMPTIDSRHVFMNRHAFIKDKIHPVRINYVTRPQRIVKKH